MPESLPDIYPNSIGDEAYADFQSLVEKYGDPQNALNIYLHGIGRMFKQIDDISKDGPNGEPGWSQIFDLVRAKTEWLPWTGQMVGYHVPVKPDAQSLATYDAEQRVAMIEQSAYKRGTVPRMRSEIQEQLIGGKRVIIKERFDDDAWVIKVWVFVEEIATSDAEVYHAAYSQKVAGLLMEVSVLEGLSYDLLRASQDDYAEVESKFASYREVSLDPGKP
jgi:hypothetical protein